MFWQRPILLVICRRFKLMSSPAFSNVALWRHRKCLCLREVTSIGISYIVLFLLGSGIGFRACDCGTLDCSYCFLHYVNFIWAASSEFGTYRLCEQRRFRRACASAQSRQNLRCSLIQAVSQEGPSDRKPDPWPRWMAGHAQLNFVMTECSKTQIRLTRPI